MSFVVLWYPKGGDGKLRPLFMQDNDDDVSLFDTEDEAETVALEAPISVQWPFVVVELP